MEQWSILSNMVNYIQYNRPPKNFFNLNIRAESKERYKRKSSIEKGEERHLLELDFGDPPEKLKEEYLDVYEEIQSEILSTTNFDENQGGKIIPNIRTRVYNGKIIRWDRMSNITGYRS